MDLDSFIGWHYVYMVNMKSDPTGISPSSGDEYFYDLEKRIAGLYFW